MRKTTPRESPYLKLGGNALHPRGRVGASGDDAAKVLPMAQPGAATDAGPGVAPVKQTTARQV